MAEPDERSRAIIDGIEAIDPRYVLHLPSSTLIHIINHMLDRPNTVTFPIPREEEGVGILSGLELAGTKSLAIIQDNGVGNLLTALTTFPMAYHIPQFYIVSRRGGLNEYNSMIHTLCERVDEIVDAAGLRSFKLDERVPVARWATTVVAAWEHAQMTHRPVLLLTNLLY